MLRLGIHLVVADAGTQKKAQGDLACTKPTRDSTRVTMFWYAAARRGDSAEMNPDTAAHEQATPDGRLLVQLPATLCGIIIFSPRLPGANPR